MINVIDKKLYKAKQTERKNQLNISSIHFDNKALGAIR